MTVTREPGTTPARGPAADGRHWAHAAETVPLVAGLTWCLAAAAWSRHWLVWQPPLLVLGVTVAALILMLMTAGNYGPVLGHTVLSGLALTGWVTAAAFWSPWTRPMIVALVALALAFGVWGVGVWAGLARRDAAHAAWLASRRRHGEFARYEAALEQAGFAGVAVAAVDRTRSGRTIRLQLPADGHVTPLMLAQALDRLEIALPGRLRSGSVRVEPDPEDASLVALHVSERDVLAELVPFPADAVERSVNDPFSVGLQEDGREASILLREVAALIIGLRGMGKSNAINVIVARLAWCVDAVIFMIDLKGGAVVKPWLEPWARGQCPRPPVDWVATSRAEAEVMLEAVLAAVDWRSAHMRGSKIRPSTGQPAIIVICDEVAVIFGLGRAGKLAPGETTNSQLAGLGTRFTELGRAAAVDPLWCTQRSTVSTIGGGDLKAQCALRIGMGVVSESDARNLIEDDARAARLLSKLLHPGSSLIWDRKRPALPVKWYRLDSDPDKDAGRIAQIAADTGWIRPGLDDGTAAAMGEAYAGRWDRDDARAIVTLLAGPGENGEAEAWAEIVDRFGADPEARMHPSHRRLRELISARKHGGLSPGEAFIILKHEGRGVARETIQRWLEKDRKDGLMERIRHGRWRIRQPEQQKGIEAP